MGRVAPQLCSGSLEVKAAEAAEAAKTPAAARNFSYSLSVFLGILDDDV